MLSAHLSTKITKQFKVELKREKTVCCSSVLTTVRDNRCAWTDANCLKHNYINETERSKRLFLLLLTSFYVIYSSCRKRQPAIDRTNAHSTFTRTNTETETVSHNRYHAFASTHTRIDAVRSFCCLLFLSRVFSFLSLLWNWLNGTICNDAISGGT